MKVKDLMAMTAIAIIIVILWRTSEILIYGEIKPNLVDSIVGGILTVSLYNNYRMFVNGKQEDKNDCEVYKNTVKS